MVLIAATDDTLTCSLGPVGETTVDIKWLPYTFALERARDGRFDTGVDQDAIPRREPPRLGLTQSVAPLLSPEEQLVELSLYVLENGRGFLHRGGGGSA